MVGCPKHRDKPSPTTCSLCASWASLEKEKQRLALQQQKLDLDRQLVKAEKKKMRRSAQMSGSTSNHDRHKLEVELKGITSKNADQMASYQAQIKTLEESNRTTVMEWKSKLSQHKAEFSDLAQAKAQIQTQQVNDEAITAALIANSTVQIEMELSNARMKLNDLEEELERAYLDRDRALEENRIEKQELEEQMESLEEQLLEGKAAWKAERKTLKAQMEELEQQQKDDSSSVGSTLQEELLKMQYEKETIAEQVTELEERCKELEEELEEQRNKDDVQNDEPVGATTTVSSCANCEDLEEDLYEMKLKLNKRQVEYQRQMRELEERLTKQNKNAVVIESSSASPSPDNDVANSSKDDDDDRKIDNSDASTPLRLSKGGEMQKVRASEIDQQKLEMKVLALEALIVSMERRKEETAAVLRDSRSETHELARQLDQLQKETRQLRLNDGKKNKTEELLQAARDETSDLEQQLETLQEAQAQQQQQQPQPQAASSSSLDQEELLRMKEEMDKLLKKQEQYAAQQKKDFEEWNTMVDTLTEKQDKVFNTALPALDSKVYQLDTQISDVIQEQEELTEELKRQEEEGLKRQQQQKAAASKNTSKPPPSPSVNRRMSNKRQPPLTKIDSHQNRHVTEFDFKTERQSGKYTGFMNSQSLPEGNGILRVDTGDVYEGEWKNGKRSGQGVYTWYDGDLYTGPWSDGKRHGHGVFVFSDGRLYDGEYNMGQREGVGMFVWPYGAKYEGSYFNDKRNGMGEYVYADGRTYRGEYKDDRPHGYGVEVAKDDTVVYDGNWAFGEFIGDQQSLGGSIAGGSIISYRR